MHRFAFCLCFVLLAACDMQPPAYYGVPATRLTIDGATYDVRVKGDRAQAIRLNAMYAPRPLQLYPQAAAAIRQVSGCDIVRGSLNGDQVITNARLKCSGRPAPLPDPEPLVSDLDCDVRDIHVNDGLEQITAVAECYPI